MQNNNNSNNPFDDKNRQRRSNPRWPTDTVGTTASGLPDANFIRQGGLGSTPQFRHEVVAPAAQAQPFSLAPPTPQMPNVMQFPTARPVTGSASTSSLPSPSIQPPGGGFVQHQQWGPTMPNLPVDTSYGWGPGKGPIYGYYPKEMMEREINPKDVASTSNESPPVITVFQADILRRENGLGALRLDVKKEQKDLQERLAHENAGVVAHLDFRVATVDNIRSFLDRGEREFLHISCHSHSGILFVEDHTGGEQQLGRGEIKMLFQDRKKIPKCVVLAACCSYSAGKAFIEEGAEYVICCKDDRSRLSDDFATIFFGFFYRNLFVSNGVNECSPDQAFAAAKNDLTLSSQFRKVGLNPKRELHKIILLKGDHSNKNKGLQLASHPPSPRQPRDLRLERLCPPPDDFVGREDAMHDVIKAMADDSVRLVSITGKKGIGKSSFASALACYMQERKTHMFGEVLVPKAWEGEVEDVLYDTMNDIRNNETYSFSKFEEICKVLREISRAVIIFDARDLTGTSIAGIFSTFLQAILDRMAGVRLIVLLQENVKVAQEAINRVKSRDYRLGPLDCGSAMRLFLSKCLSLGDDMHVENELLQFLRNDIESFRTQMGNFHPKTIVDMASGLLQMEADAREALTSLAARVSFLHDLDKTRYELEVRGLLREDSYQELAPQGLPATSSSSRTKIDTRPIYSLPLPANFVGRDLEISAIKKKMMHNNVRLISITGRRGIGKKTFAKALAQEIQENKHLLGFDVFMAQWNRPRPGGIDDLLHKAKAKGFSIDSNDSVKPEAIRNVLAGKRAVIFIDASQQHVTIIKRLSTFLLHLFDGWDTRHVHVIVLLQNSMQLAPELTERVSFQELALKPLHFHPAMELFLSTVYQAFRNDGADVVNNCLQAFNKRMNGFNPTSVLEAATEFSTRPEEDSRRKEFVKQAAYTYVHNDPRMVPCPQDLPPKKEKPVSLASFQCRLLPKKREDEGRGIKIYRKISTRYIRKAKPGDVVTGHTGGESHRMVVPDGKCHIVYDPRTGEYSFLSDNDFEQGYDVNSKRLIQAADDSYFRSRRFYEYAPIGQVWAYAVDEHDIAFLDENGTGIAKYSEGPGEITFVNLGDYMVSKIGDNNNLMEKVDRETFDKTYSASVRTQEMARDNYLKRLKSKPSILRTESRYIKSVSKNDKFETFSEDPESEEKAKEDGWVVCRHTSMPYREHTTPAHLEFYFISKEQCNKVYDQKYRKKIASTSDENSSLCGFYEYQTTYPAWVHKVEEDDMQYFRCGAKSANAYLVEPSGHVKRVKLGDYLVVKRSFTAEQDEIYLLDEEEEARGKPPRRDEIGWNLLQAVDWPRAAVVIVLFSLPLLGRSFSRK